MYAPDTSAPRRVVPLPQPVVVAPIAAPRVGARPMNYSQGPDERVPVVTANVSGSPDERQAPTVAPVMPRPMPNAIAAGRGVPANPAQQVAAVAAPVAYAMSQYKEHGNPWTAAGEGFVNASAYNEGQAQDQAKREQAAQLLKDYPDLQKQVETGTLDLGSAITLAQSRDSQKATGDRKAQILDYLKQSGDTDIAEQFANGVLDEDGVAKALQVKDGGGNPTDDQKELAQINSERKTAGQPEMTMEEYLAKKKDGFGAGTTDTIDDLPVVQLDEKGLPDKSGQQAFLDQLDPDVASIVKGVANYEMDITKVTSLKGGERQRLAQLVKQYDPTFDMSQYTARAAMRKSITSGQYSQSINSANLVIQHLDTLSKAADDLHNQGGLLTPWNKIANPTKNAFGAPEITKFNEAKQAVASELAKVFKGTGVAAESEIQEWLKTFDDTASPEQMKAAIAQGIDLLKSRIDTIHTQYNSAMGKPTDFAFLTPHTRKVLKDLGYDPTALDPASGPDEGDPDFAGADKPGEGPDDPEKMTSPVLDPSNDQGKAAYDALPDGATYTVPGDPTIYVKQSKK